MMRGVERTLIGIALFLACTALTLLGVNSFRQLWLSLIDPFEFISVEIDPPIERGDHIIEIKYTFIRNRYCQTDLNLFIAKMPLNEIIWRDRTQGGATTTMGYTIVKNRFAIS